MGLNSHWGDSYVNWYLFGRFTIVNCCFYACKEDQQALYNAHHYDVVVKAKLDRDYRISNVISYITRGELCFFQIETANSENSGGINQLKDAINNIILENDFPLNFNDATTFNSSNLNNSNSRQNATKGAKSNSVVYLSFLRAILRFVSLKLMDTHFLFESATQSLSFTVIPFSSHMLVSNTFQKKTPTLTSYSILRLNPVISAKDEILININSTRPLFYKLKDFLDIQETAFCIYVIPSAMKYSLAMPTLKESITDEKVEGSEALFKMIKDLFNLNIVDTTKWVKLISPFNKKELLWPVDLCVIQFASDFKSQQLQEFDLPGRAPQMGDVYDVISDFINLKIENDSTTQTSGVNNETIVSEAVSDEDASEINNSMSVKPSTSDALNAPSGNDGNDGDEWDDLFGSDDDSQTQFIAGKNIDHDTNDDDLDQQLDELFNTESPSTNIMPIEHFPSHSEEPDNFNDPFPAPYKEAYSSPLYQDPGAPSPQEFQIFATTPDSTVDSINANASSAAGSIFSPLLFNPLIERDIDSKYSNGGKFHFKQDTSLNNSNLFKMKSELNSDSSDSDNDAEGMHFSQFTEGENDKSDEELNDDEDDEKEYMIGNEFDEDYDDEDPGEIDGNNTTTDNFGGISNTNAASSTAAADNIHSSGLDLIGLNQYDLYQEETLNTSQILVPNMGTEEPFTDIQLPVNWTNILRPRMAFQGPFKLFQKKPTLNVNLLPVLQELVFSYNPSAPTREGSRLVDSDLEFLMTRLFKGVRKLTFRELFTNSISGDRHYDCLFRANEIDEDNIEPVPEIESMSNVWDISHAMKCSMLQSKIKGNKDKVFLNETSLSFWKILNLNPYHDKKDFVMVFLVPKISDYYSKKTNSFKEELVDAYSDLGLGKIKSCQLIELPRNDFWKAASTYLNENTKGWSFTRNDDVLIMAVNPEKIISVSSLVAFCETCGIFKKVFPHVTTFYKLLELDTFASTEVDQLVLFTREEYWNFSLHLYSMCPTDHSLQNRKPPVYVGEEPAIKLSLNQLESPINDDQYLHVCYERSMDKNWVVASWVNQHGDLNYTKTWYAGKTTTFSQISDEIMNVSFSYAANHTSKTFMILTRLNNVFPDDELSEWKRLSMNRRVCLIVVTADPEPCTLMMTNNPGMNIIKTSYNQGASNKALSTPGTAILVSTNPNFHFSSLGNGPGSSARFESPDLTMFTPSYDIVASPLDQTQLQGGTQIPHPSLPSVSEQVDVPVLVDIDQTTIGIILPTSQVLSNQNVRVPLKTGYLIKHGDRGLIENKCIEVNLLSCYPTLGVEDVLLKIMKQYKDLSVLNKFWGVKELTRSIGPVEFEKVWVEDDNEKLQYLQFRKQQQSQVEQHGTGNIKDEDTILPAHILTVRKMMDIVGGLSISEDPL